MYGPPKENPQTGLPASDNLRSTLPLFNHILIGHVGPTLDQEENNAESSPTLAD